MTVSITNNPDGSIVVTCGSESVVIDRDVVITNVDPDDPVFGFPLPPALVGPVGDLRAGSLTDIPKLFFDCETGTIEWDEVLIREAAGRKPIGSPLLVSVDATPGKPFDLSTLTTRVRQLRAIVDRPILPVLRTKKSEK